MHELWEALKPAVGEAAGFFIVCAIIGLLAVLLEARRIIARRCRVSVAVMLDEIAKSDRSPRGVR
jgi:hypothetical protein